MSNLEIGERIKEIRELCGLKQKQLAVKLGKSQNTVKNYEKNLTKTIPMAVCQKMAEMDPKKRGILYVLEGKEPPSLTNVPTKIKGLPSPAVSKQSEAYTTENRKQLVDKAKRLALEGRDEGTITALLKLVEVALAREGGRLSSDDEDKQS